MDKSFNKHDGLIWQSKDINEETINPLQRLAETLAFTSRDCSEDKMIAFMYAIICGWDDASFNELMVKHGWTLDDIKLMKAWHDDYKKAWNLFVIDYQNENKTNG